MKTLYRHIFLSYLGPMFLTIFIVVFIFLIQSLWLWIDEIVGKGFSLSHILEFLFWIATANLSMALPLATLFASLMTMGNLGENNELLAMKASGISLHKILYPLYVTIACVTVFAFFMSSEYVPFAYLRMRVMLQEIRKTSPELSIPEDIFYDGIEKTSIRVSHKDPKTGALIDVMIYNHREGEGNVSVTIADTAYIKQTQDSRYILFRLINGVTYSESLKNNRLDVQNYPFDRRFFTEQNISIDLGEEESQSFEAIFKENTLAKSISTLKRDSDTVRSKLKIIVDKFENTHLTSPSSFRYTLKDTLNKRHKELTVNVDSMFNVATATQKMLWLDQMTSNSTRVIGYWNNELRDIQIEMKKLKSMEYERNRKFTLAFACVIFFLIGASLGAIIRKGGLGMPAVISIFFFVIYWVIETICGKMVRNGDWSPAISAWFSSMLLTPLGIFLSYKANTDSRLFNIEAYTHYFNVIFGRMKKLILAVDFEKITPLPENQVEILLKNNDKPELLDRLISQYIENHKLGKTFQSGKTILKMNQNDDLLEIKSLYDFLISFYYSINDDVIRAAIKRFPQLEPSEFVFPKFLANRNVFLRIPYSIILIFIKIRRAKKLEYILRDIAEINMNINKYIYERHKTQYDR